MLVGAKVVAALVSVLVLVLTGIGWIGHPDLSSGITTSEALAGVPASVGADQNILIMGLDSRLDQQGRPLPQDFYDALHAGDENSGEYDADVLIVLHVPGGGGQVTAISIPRDDYVDLAGCPAGQCRGKIKHAYSLAYQRVMDRRYFGNVRSNTTAADARDAAAQEQSAREAGREAEISTVRRLLGIPIDHFIEVSLVAFFQIAQVVEPINVCLNEDTTDPDYSGADFHQGIEQINAAQAMAFVRQRRDVHDELFTDLDRTRRQQAFIASLVGALRHSRALWSPGALHHLMDVARQNVAVDAGFDLTAFVRNASAFSGSPLVLYTLPITEFSQISDGEDVNIIDVPTIRSIVHDLMATDSPSTASPSSANSTAEVGNNTQTNTASIVLNVTNASGEEGVAAALETSLGTGQFMEGTASTAESTTGTSAIEYGPGAEAAATALADELDLSATASETVAPNTVHLTAGTDFNASDYLDHNSSASEATTTITTLVAAVAATATGTETPAPTNLTRMSAEEVPCVK